jgi:hypothetical protein
MAHTDRLHRRHFGRLGLAAAVVLLHGAPGAADPPPWQVVGRLGVVQYVVVPESAARQRGYYDTIIQQSCPPAGTCFMRFFTNSSGATPTLPLPDVIQNEPAALFQRSAKRGTEEFRFSCRLQVAGADCF